MSARQLKDAWILDSGASRYMCNNRRRFYTYRTINRIPVETANGLIYVIREGSIYMEIKNSKSHVTEVELTKVLYIPDLIMNLVLTSSLFSIGGYFNRCTCTLYTLDSDIEFGYAPIRNGIHLL